MEVLPYPNKKQIPGYPESGKNHFEITIEAGSKADGSRDRIKRRFHGTITEAKAFKLQLESVIAKGSFLKPAKMTTGKYLTFWLERINDNRTKQLKPKTVEWYHERIKSLLPSIGGVPLDKLNAIHIQNYIRDARNKGQKPRRNKTEHKGTVSVAGKEVQWLSGDRFVKCLAGQPAEINSQAFIIASWNSSTRLTLSASAGQLAKASYKVDLAEFKPYWPRLSRQLPGNCQRILSPGQVGRGEQICSLPERQRNKNQR